MQTTSVISPLAHSRRRTLYVPEVDLYGTIHRGLRLAMSELLLRMGTTVPSDAEQVLARVRELDTVFFMIARHIEHEERFIHGALDRRRPGASRRLDIEHEEHATSISELATIAAGLRSANDATRVGFYRALYLRYAAFVGETFVHMSEEEEMTQPLLEDLFNAAELHALHQELLASIPQDELLETVQWMLPAIDIESRVALLAGPKASMPPDVFAEMFAVACSRLSAEETVALATRLA